MTTNFNIQGTLSYPEHEYWSLESTHSPEELNEVGVMIGVVVDVDDTLVNTQRRVWRAWCHVLGREIPFETVESLGSRQILEKFGSSDQGLWNRFWKILLCVEKTGIDLLKLDEPIPFAAETLQKWTRQSRLVYLTGRPNTMRGLTLDELEEFGYPTYNIQLMMFNLEDWENFSSSVSLIETRRRLFSSISKQYNIVRVVDDYPSFFPIYQQFKIPERIGLLRPKRFSTQDYINQGATRVVENWKQLQDNILGQVPQSP